MQYVALLGRDAFILTAAEADRFFNEHPSATIYEAHLRDVTDEWRREAEADALAQAMHNRSFSRPSGY